MDCCDYEARHGDPRGPDGRVCQLAFFQFRDTRIRRLLLFARDRHDISVVAPGDQQRMYEESLIESLYGMLSGSNAPMTKRQFIHDFRSFILDHIPYASVKQDALQMGLVQFDGP